MSEELQFRQKGETGVITFNRPEARNALTFDMYESLAKLCESVLDKSLLIRSLIITGAGDRAFAAGTDIAAFRDFRSEEDALGYERTMDRVLGLLESLPIPTVAAIRGACTGGGAAIAACCDLRVASEDIRFGFPIARTLGNCLSVGNLSHALCEVMHGNAPLTIAASKEGLRRLREHAAAVKGDDLIIQCYTSHDFREGMDAFLAKRKPQWQGR